MIIYLMHINLVANVGVKLFVNNNILRLILHMAVASVVIYLLCWMVYLVYAKFEKVVFDFLKKKCKLPLIEI